MVFCDTARPFPVLACLLLVFLVLVPMHGGYLAFRYANDPLGVRRHYPVPIERTLAGVVSGDDVVVCNDALYYAVRGRAKDRYPLRRVLCDGFRPARSPFWPLSTTRYAAEGFGWTMF